MYIEKRGDFSNRCTWKMHVQILIECILKTENAAVLAKGAQYWQIYNDGIY